MLRSLSLLAALVGSAILSSCGTTGGAGSLGKVESQQLCSILGRSGAAFFPAAPSERVVKAAAGLPRDRWGMPNYALAERSRLVRTTAYSCKENEPGACGNLNATGTELRFTSSVRSAAADWSRYPLGTKFKIKGLPYTYVVDDYGSGLVGAGTLDIYHPTLELMRAWGARPVEITVIQWGSFERSLALLERRRQYPHCNQMYASILRQTGGQVALAR